MSISEELKRVYASAPDNVYYIETLSIAHSGITGGAVYITNKLGGFTGQLEDTTPVNYIYAPFNAIPPQSAEENNINLQVSIANAGSDLIKELESMSANPVEPIIVTYRVYLSSDLNTVQNDPPLVLEVLTVSVTDLLINFSAGLANLRRRKFPSVVYTIDKYPGLAR